MTPSPYSVRFVSAHDRARIVKILLVVGAIATALSLVAEALSLTFPPITEEQELADNPMGAVIVMMVLLLAVLELIIYIATVVLFCMWLHRSYANLRAIDPSARLDYSPGWAVGSFFIPLVNLVVPYRAVRETWQKSGPPDEALLMLPKPPIWFPIWWTFWLLASFAGNISMRASFNENVSETTATMTSITAGGFSLVAALFAYFVVDAIDQRQEETSAKVKLGDFSGPPPPPVNLPVREVVAPT